MVALLFGSLVVMLLFSIPIGIALGVASMLTIYPENV